MYTNIHQSPFVGDLSHYQQYLERKEREEVNDKTSQKTKQGGVQSVKLAKQHQTFSVFKAPLCLEDIFCQKKILTWSPCQCNCLQHSNIYHAKLPVQYAVDMLGNAAKISLCKIGVGSCHQSFSYIIEGNSSVNAQTLSHLAAETKTYHICFQNIQQDMHGLKDRIFTATRA